MMMTDVHTHFALLVQSLFGIDESAGGSGVNGTTSTVHTGLPLIDTLIKAGTFITTAQ